MAENIWRIEQVVLTDRGEIPLDQARAEERRQLAENIYVAFARAQAPEGVQVRLARGSRRPAVGE